MLGGESVSLKHTRIEQLDQCLCDLLGHVQKQNKWFDPWTRLLLGDSKPFDFKLTKLREDLTSKCNNDVHESILNLAIGGDSHRVECLSKLISKKGCYVGGIESSGTQEGAEKVVSN